MRAEHAERPAAVAGFAARGPAVIGAVAAVVLGLLVVIVVARSTPGHVFTSHQGTVRPTPAPSSAAAQRRAALPRTSRPHAGHLPTVVLVIAIAVFLLAVAALLLWFVLLSQTRGRARLSRRRAAHRDSAGRLVDAVSPDEARSAVADAVENSLVHEIGRGEVAEAIIRSWLAVEAALHYAGLATRRSDTSTDLVERALASLGVREAALRSLASLYREARFSTHVLGETHRESARRDLVMIASDLVGNNHVV